LENLVVLITDRNIGDDAEVVRNVALAESVVTQDVDGSVALENDGAPTCGEDRRDGTDIGKNGGPAVMVHTPVADCSVFLKGNGVPTSSGNTSHAIWWFGVSRGFEESI